MENVNEGVVSALYSAILLNSAQINALAEVLIVTDSQVEQYKAKLHDHVEHLIGVYIQDEGGPLSQEHARKLRETVR